MTKLTELQNQIEKLQLKLAEIKKRDCEKVIVEILSNMQTYGISISDLAKAKRMAAKNRSADGRTKVARKPKKVSQTAVVVVPKFQGPNGETWTGRGLTPRWLAALIAQGHTKEEFTIRN